jgi:hypothetical protein
MINFSSQLTGIAVIPVVCYLGELREQLAPNVDKVSEVFTIPLKDFLDSDLPVGTQSMLFPLVETSTHSGTCVYLRAN